ncbi:hypothetical protein TRAPUB_754 [Trametes pubescens]|uniref:Uncharacterized protein n=1 Tax=Trametes pubescens TaxID=154538 RepID=A0A1M2VJN7_TRAPU|nr:hypothetical protein TRAPUB_7404 [Trametes pubescens]OJT07777.1 hypothetical protein TRAPUB_1369 [Trametes pubescens]OJT08350.1 hypothetical protein TRAPUB_754 [Trametes pubescens]
MSPELDSHHPSLSSAHPPFDTLVAVVHPDSEPTPSLSNHDGPILDGDFEKPIEEARVSLQALEESSDDEDFEAPVANEPMPQEPVGLVFPPAPMPQLMAEALRRVPTYTHRSPKTNIPLSSLFNYRRNPDPSASTSAATVSARASGRQAAGIPLTARLDFFWDDGARSLAREASCHDALEADAAVHGAD